ncbi:MAG: YHS domain-containing protein, partial [Planctomycetes bacterium]|nr:YHS domain-containing protein [Planctomycetota bacterium]
AQDKRPQTICPVMGGKIDKNVHTDFQGQRIYFCCPGCVAKFKADPDKYLKNLKKNPSLRGEEHGSLQHQANGGCGWGTCWHGEGSYQMGCRWGAGNRGGCSWSAGNGAGCCWGGNPHQGNVNRGGCCG